MSCIDRPFVQLEVREALQAQKQVMTIFEEERRRASFFDYGAAWSKCAFFLSGYQHFA